MYGSMQMYLLSLYTLWTCSFCGHRTLRTMQTLDEVDATMAKSETNACAGSVNNTGSTPTIDDPYYIVSIGAFQEVITPGADSVMESVTQHFSDQNGRRRLAEGSGGPSAVACTIGTLACTTLLSPPDAEPLSNLCNTVSNDYVGECNVFSMSGSSENQDSCGKKIGIALVCGTGSDFSADQICNNLATNAGYVYQAFATCALHTTARNPCHKQMWIFAQVPRTRGRTWRPVSP